MPCKVESRPTNPHASWDEREKAFKTMLAIFKKRVSESGIISEYKQRQFYESPGEKTRRKKKESDRLRQRAIDGKKVREYFGKD